MKTIIQIICISLFAIGMNSCQKDETLEPALTQKIKIAEQDLKTEGELAIYADKDISVGYQKLYFEVKKDGKVVKNLDLSFMPDMDMGTMKHGAPFGKPVFSDALGAYEGFVVFTMASGDAGSWDLKVKIKDQTYVVPVVVKAAATGNTPVKTFTGTDGKKYVLALIEPLKPKIGLNDLDVMLFLRETMYSFPVADGFTLKFHPEMTSMNHGSSNNQDPVGKGNGLYKGKVNFSMSGDWRLFFDINKGETNLGKDVFLDVLF